MSVTVLLELEWMLRGFYPLPRRDVVRAIRALAGIEHRVMEDRDGVLTALDAVDRGVDFADALHVARSARATTFATFEIATGRCGPSRFDARYGGDDVEVAIVTADRLESLVHHHCRMQRVARHQGGMVVQQLAGTIQNLR